MPDIMFVRVTEYETDYDQFFQYYPMQDTPWTSVTEKELKDYQDIINYHNSKTRYKKREPEIQIIVREDMTTIAKILNDTKIEMELEQKKKLEDQQKRKEKAEALKLKKEQKDLEEKKKLLAQLQKELGQL